MTQPGDPPGDAEPLEPSPRRQAWSAAAEPPDAVTEAMGPAYPPGQVPPAPAGPGTYPPETAPTVLITRRRDRGAWLWISLTLAAVIALVIAGVLWWFARPGDPVSDGSITASSQVQVGDCVRVTEPTAQEHSKLLPADCGDVAVFSYLVADKVARADRCPEGFSAFTLPDQSEPGTGTACLVPNLLAGQCYELRATAADASPGPRPRRVDCTVAAPQQPGAMVVRVDERFDTGDARCDPSIDTVIEVSDPHPMLVCMERLAG